MVELRMKERQKKILLFSIRVSAHINYEYGDVSQVETLLFFLSRSRITDLRKIFTN